MKTYKAYISASIEGHSYSITDETQVCAENEKEAREIINELIENRELFNNTEFPLDKFHITLEHVFDAQDAELYGTDYIPPEGSELTVTANITIIKKDGETNEEAFKRLEDIVQGKLCNLPNDKIYADFCKGYF